MFSGIFSGFFFLTDETVIHFSFLISLDSSHANREERMKTTRTEPNFCC